MPAENTEALVLRVTEFSETSLVVVLLTRDFGKIAVLAKGARRPKSPFEGAIDLLAVCRVIVWRKSAEHLSLLTEAKLKKRFRAGEKDLHRLYAGYYLVELLREFTDEGDPQEELFFLAERTQDLLHEATDVMSLITWSESQLMRMTGHFPLLGECVVCRRPVDTKLTRHLFSLPLGGLVCEGCRIGQSGLVTFGETVRRIWSNYADSDDWVIPEGWDRTVCGELRGLATRWISHTLGHRLRMFDQLHG